MPSTSWSKTWKRAHERKKMTEVVFSDVFEKTKGKSQWFYARMAEMATLCMFFFSAPLSFRRFVQKTVFVFVVIW